MKTKSKNHKAVIRLLNILVRANEAVIVTANENTRIKLISATGSNSFEQHIVDEAIATGIILQHDNSVSITPAGRSKLKRLLCDHDPYSNQHRELKKTGIEKDDRIRNVIINCSESPLARLYSRKSKDGSRYFTHSEFESGNRLRRDFEKARMQPSITANWGMGTQLSGNGRRGPDRFELSDFAIDARTRLEKALDAIGPELAGVTLDICCFLKGFEVVEQERRWPARSAKLMLKTALASLSRHYGHAPDTASRSKAKNPKIDHWGTSDYRPTL